MHGNVLPVVMDGLLSLSLSLLIVYNNTLYNRCLTNKLMLSLLSLSVQTKPKSNPRFTPALRAFRSTVRHAVNLWKCTHSATGLAFYHIFSCNHDHRLNGMGGLVRISG